MIRELGEAIGDTVVESVGRAVGRTQEQWPLPADLLESDDAYLVVFDAPGVEREDVQVRFEDGEVRVRLDRFREFHEGYDMRFPGRGLSLDGSASLPQDAPVDPSGASATLRQNGTLQVRVPKGEPAEVANAEPAEPNEDAHEGEETHEDVDGEEDESGSDG
jgi:HSP20 family molecular chaperone IbpA